MINKIPDPVRRRMKYLEDCDARDRSDGTALAKRLKQVTPEVGRFIAILAATAPPGQCVEIGTSAGYSTLWLALSCQAVGRKLTTFEVLKEKADLARETFAATGMTPAIHFVHDDALPYLHSFQDIAFCFLDADKEIYGPCYEAVIPNMVTGGLLIADNATSHAAALEPMLRRALTDERVDAVVVPIGRGELLCRKL
jgi:predicted O-methyltransferase YrrM